MKTRITLPALFLALALLLTNVSPVFAVPPTPSSFYGTVKLDGANVPLNTVVHALVNGVEYASATVQLYEGDTVYSLNVPGDDTSTPGAIEGGSPGDTVVFYIGSNLADQTATWTSGTNVELNLSVTANHPPTAADNTVITLEDTDKVFAAANFNFSDADPGDTLSQIMVTTVESAGALYLDDNTNGSIDTNEDITLNQVILAADIAKLKFKPALNANGSPYATFGFKVHDGHTYSVSAYQMTINVTAVNDAPSFVKGADQTVDEDAGLQSVSGWATAINDGDPETTQTLTFNVSGNTNPGLFSVGPAINATNGNLTYTPAANANGNATVTLTLSDNGGTSNGGVNVSGPQSFVITVNPINDAPVLNAVGDKSVNEGVQLSFTATASDIDHPANTLTFSLVGAPAGASITSGGVFSWTPTEVQGPGSYDFTIRVCDNGSPVLCDGEEITVNVNEVNIAPVLNAVGDKSVNEGSHLNFTATASDTDLPVNSLTFSLVGAPAGASITPGGVFSWTPTEAQGPGSYDFTVRVCDNGSPVLCDGEEIIVTVNEVNASPVLDAVGDKSVNEGSHLNFTATASDIDLPANTLTFSLVGAPTGASITSGGIFSWTPTEAQGPGSYDFTVRVCDNGSPILCDGEEITVTVNEVNTAPILNFLGDKNIPERIEFTFMGTGTDSDLPANTLTYSMIGGPAGASMTPGGVFSWTPTETQGPGSYDFTVRVCDNGSPILCDEEEITITVNEVNASPVLNSVGDKSVNEGSLLSFTATASDVDLPANTLVFSLVGAPAGANITSGGVFSWTPTEAQGPGSYDFTVRVCDNVSPILCDGEEITVTVNEVNVAPVLNPIGDKTAAEGSELSFTATASDVDLPANTLVFSLVGAPAGANITPGGVFSWTPTEAQGPGSYDFTVWVCDNGSPILCDEEEINVTVSEVTFNLTIIVDPSLGGTTEPEAGIHVYPSGSVADITAFHADGYEFDHWSGACTGTGACQVTMDDNKSVTAHFVELPPTCYTLTLSHTGQGSDPVASPTHSEGCDSGMYVEGEIVALSDAVPDGNWKISGWMGTDDDVSTADNNTVTMPASDHSASVVYKYSIYLPILINGPAASGSELSRSIAEGKDAVGDPLPKSETRSSQYNSDMNLMGLFDGDQSLYGKTTFMDGSPFLVFLTVEYLYNAIQASRKNKRVRKSPM